MKKVYLLAVLVCSLCLSQSTTTINNLTELQNATDVFEGEFISSEVFGVDKTGNRIPNEQIDEALNYTTVSFTKIKIHSVLKSSSLNVGDTIIIKSTSDQYQLFSYKDSTGKSHIQYIQNTSSHNGSGRFLSPQFSWLKGVFFCNRNTDNTFSLVNGISYNPWRYEYSGSDECIAFGLSQTFYTKVQIIDFLIFISLI